MPINTRALETFRNITPSGVHLDDAERLKRPNNGICDFVLFEQDRRGATSPALRTEYNPNVEDPTPVASYGISGSDAASLAASLKAKIDEHRSHLYPNRSDFDFKTKAQFNFVVGQRVTQFLEEAESAIAGLPRVERAAANDALDAIDRQLWDRDVDFNEGGDLRMTTYGPYNEPQVAFLQEMVNKFEAIDAELLTPAQRASLGRAHKQAQRKLDIIRRDHWVMAKGRFKSSDGEAGKGGALIDTESRQRISIDPRQNAEDAKFRPRYVIMNVTVGGEDKAVYRDHNADKYYFDGGSEEVPANLVDQIRTSNLPANAATRGYRISARPYEPGETARKDFPFDQTRRGEISNQPITWIGWAGLCHNQGMSEANGAVAPKSHPGHTEYVSGADREFSYDADAINGLFLEIPDLGSRMDRVGGWGQIDIGEQRYGGFRRNEEPGRMDFGGITIPNDKRRRGAFRFQAITKNGERISSGAFFRERIAEADPNVPNRYTSRENPDYVTTTQGDSVEARLGDAVVEANVEFERYGSEGYPVREKEAIKLDLENRPDVDVMVDAYRTGHHRYAEVSVNLAQGQATVQHYSMERQADGSYEAKEGRKETRRLRLDDVSGVRESDVDAPSSWVPLIEHSRKTGEGIVFESADDYEIWNSKMDEANRSTLHADDANVTAEYEFDSKFGDGSAKFVYDRTGSGGRENYTGIDQEGDFWWLSNHAFRAFGDGYVNAGAEQQGIIDVEGRVVHADMFTDMCEILHAAFRSEGYDYSIVHDGKRYMYDDKAAYEADKAALQAARAEVYGTGGGGNGGQVTIGELHKVSGQLPKDEFETGTITLDADGKVELKLRTLDGDADLYVNHSGTIPTNDDFEHQSWNGGRQDDTITIDGKKGDKISFAVHGWDASNFELTVTGPKAA